MMLGKQIMGEELSNRSGFGTRHCLVGCMMKRSEKQVPNYSCGFVLGQTCFFLLRHFDHFLQRRFGHLSHSCIRSRHGSVH